MMLQAAFASLTACRPLRNDASEQVAGNHARSLSALARVILRGWIEMRIELLQRLCVFSKVRVDLGSEQGGLNKTRILSERFVAILNSKVVFALPYKNLSPKIQRRPERGISVKRRIQIALCTCNIAMFQPIFRIRE
jgi:hypothetical protein